MNNFGANPSDLSIYSNKNRGKPKVSILHYSLFNIHSSLLGLAQSDKPKLEIFTSSASSSYTDYRSNPRRSVMSVKETILQVTMAALAVIGFYGVLHAVFEWMLTPRELAAAVVITRDVSPEELNILLCEARRTLLGRGKRVVLAIPSALWKGSMRDSDEYAAVIERYGAEVALLDALP
jgi:hypothetical protein